MGRPTIKSHEEFLYMREAGLIVAEVHRALREACKPGMTTAQLDRVAHDVTIEAGGTPNFLNYHGFPASVCISINSTIVHGIPGDQRVEEGDLVSFDCGAKVVRAGQDWHADAAFTMVAGSPQPSATLKRRLELSQITQNSMWAGLAAVDGAKRVSEIGAAVEDYVEVAELEFGWTPGIIEGYTGHGIGNLLHEDPEVYNYRVRGRGQKLRPGMALCVEPMLVSGSIVTEVLEDEWTVIAVDGGDAAHWEHTVAILEDGISILTAPDGGVEGLAPYGVVPVSLGK